MDEDRIDQSYAHKPPPFLEKIKLYISALGRVPFYRYGEIGNIVYTIGKNILDGIILYTMFSMAEAELKVAAILGIVAKYIYPGITIVSSTYASGFMDHLEAFKKIKNQIKRLITAQMGIAMGQALGGLLLFCCFPPVFKYLFYDLEFKGHLIVVLYLLHHVCDGSAQIVEGRTWFKIIEIKIRRGMDENLSRNFWVIYAVSQNVQLIIGQLFIWSALGLTTKFSASLSNPWLTGMVVFGLIAVVISKFILPAAYRLHLCS
ncbi:MAG: hypothetical protein MUE70_03150 [Desulfobacterales bacterium]|jgi:hypothetical protein|nr:hypothetical protein [Desulfobacterales bacterium]